MQISRRPYIFHHLSQKETDFVHILGEFIVCCLVYITITQCLFEVIPQLTQGGSGSLIKRQLIIKMESAKAFANV